METPSAVEARQAGGEAMGGHRGEEIELVRSNPGGLSWLTLPADNHSSGSGSGIGCFPLEKDGARVTHTSEGEIDAEIVKGMGRPSLLSASAKEFTPFGGGYAGLPAQNDNQAHVWQPRPLGVGLVQVGDGAGNEGGGQSSEKRMDEASRASSDGVEEGLYAQVQLEAELLEIMAESFSEFSLECLQLALAKSDWDLDRASAGVLSALQASDPERPSTSKPCRHLLLGGECLRSDCAFSHDFAATTCRYWLHGRCLHSNECVFRHDLEVPLGDQEGPPVDNGPEEQDGGPDQAAAVPNARGHGRDDGHDRTRSGVVDVLANEDFPSLEPKPQQALSVPPKHQQARPDEGRGGDVLLDALVPTATRGKENPRKRGSRGRKTRFTPVNIQALMRPNPDSGDPARAVRLDSPSQAGSVGLAHELDYPGRHDGIGLAQSTLPTTKLRPKSGVSFAEAVGSTKPGLVLSKAWDRNGRVDKDSSGNGGDGSRVTAWVSTGDAVALQYEGARKEAAELARARNKLFTSATEAFRRGQGKVARDLARRGRELNAEMKEKHRQAASAIFSARNPADQIFERRTIDLHALHVNEALEVLDTQLVALSERNVRSVRVLAGTGHHSKGPASKARLIPAVENFCQLRGFSHRLVADHGTAHVGMVEIDLAGY